MPCHIHWLLLVLLSLLIARAVCHVDVVPTFLHRRDYTTGRRIDASELERRRLHSYQVATAGRNLLQRNLDYASLWANTTSIGNGEVVQLQWTWNPISTKAAWIGIYSPPSAEPSDYLDYIDIPAGLGTASFRLFDMRADYAFRMWGWDGEEGAEVPAGNSFKLLAESQTVSFKSQAPMHGHLGLTGDPTEMRVIFTSGSDNKAYVEYGPEGEQSTHTVMASTSTYGVENLCQGPANITASGWFRDPGFIHEAVITDLVPGKRYVYRYGRIERFSEFQSFTAAKSGANEITSVLVAADLGVLAEPTWGMMGNCSWSMFGWGEGDASRAVNEWSRCFAFGSTFHENGTLPMMIKDSHSTAADAALLIGDLSYAIGHAYLWEQFMTLLEPLGTRMPIMTAPGNHEHDYELGSNNDPSLTAAEVSPSSSANPNWPGVAMDSNGECSVPFAARFKGTNAGNAVFWYSYDLGSVHYVSLSSEHDFTLGTAQRTWLEQDFRRVNRKYTPWVVVLIHRPMYTAAVTLVDEEDPAQEIAQRLLAELEDLFYKYHVNLVISGHVHSYERSCAVYKGKCSGSGAAPVYIVNGNGGATLRSEASWINRLHYKEGRQASHTYGVATFNASKAWCVKSGLFYGYARLEAHGKSYLHYKVFYNANGSVFDEVVIKPWQGTVERMAPFAVAVLVILALCGCIAITVVIYRWKQLKNYMEAMWQRRRISLYMQDLQELEDYDSDVESKSSDHNARGTKL
eukprot:jgi/Chlat1/3649/Chrsp238S00262